MDINTLVKLTNQKLAGETLLYSQLEPYFDDVIDKINTELNAIFPTFSEHRERNQTDSGIPAYTYFPDMYIRSVVVVGAAVGFYTVDEEGIITAQQMQVEYNTNLFMMKRDYSEQVPEKYKATGRGYLTGGNFYVNTDCKQCMSANNGHCPKTCGIMDLYPDLRYVPIQGPPGPAGASVIAVSDTEPTDKACKIWIKAYEDYAEVYTRNDTGAFVYLTKILSKADIDKLQSSVSFDGTITLEEVNSEQCHTNRGVFKILNSENNTYGGILLAWGLGTNPKANRQFIIKPSFNGTSMLRIRSYVDGMWKPWREVIDTASYAKTSDLDTHINDTNNPHKLTKAALGLGNVDNTADADKAVLSAKKLFNTRKINGVDFNGTEDITVEDVTKIPLMQKGRPNGVATLGSDGIVPVDELPANLMFDCKVPVTNESFFESIPWKIADGVHKLVEDLSTGIPIGISVYKGILISASHTVNVIKLVDTGNTINCYEKYITQTLIYTQSGEKTEIKTRNACITTLQDTGELYEETYGDWEDAFATASYVDNAIFSAMESISPEQHAAVFRGKNLGSTITDAQKAAIADGSFKDLFIGDYWVINNITWRIADMDYWYNTSKNALTRHHLVMIPDTCLFEHIMKNSGSPDVPSTTKGGYHLTVMHRTGLNKARSMVTEAFGADMCVSHKEAFVNAVTNGKPSGFLFEDSWLDLPTEIMMYGTNIFSVASDGSTPPPAGITYCRTQLALFDIAPKFIVSPRQTYWLRDIVSDGQYAAVNAGGYATHSGSEFSLGVRPVFCIG